MFSISVFLLTLNYHLTIVHVVAEFA